MVNIGEIEYVATMKDRVNLSIAEIKVIPSPYPSTSHLTTLQSLHLLIAGGPKDRNSQKLSDLLYTTVGVTIPALDILKDASDMIPVPFVKPLIAGISGLLKATQVSY